jgi:hypothetical protein
MLFVAVDPKVGALSFAWLVPSEDFAAKFRKANSQGRFVFAASTKEGSRDQWSRYRCQQAELPARIFAALDHLAP